MSPARWDGGCGLPRQSEDWFAMTGGAAVGGRASKRRTDLVAACLHQEKRNYYQVLPCDMPRGGSRSCSGTRPIRAATTFKSCQPPKTVPPPGRTPGARGRRIGPQRGPCRPRSFFPSPFFEKKGDPPEGLRLIRWSRTSEYHPAWRRRRSGRPPGNRSRRPRSSARRT